MAIKDRNVAGRWEIRKVFEGFESILKDYQRYSFDKQNSAKTSIKTLVLWDNVKSEKGYKQPCQILADQRFH